MDIKHSEHKSLTAFLKVSAKEGLIKLKESKGEVMVTGVYRIDEVRVLFSLRCYAGVDRSHPSIDEHANHVTVQEIEEKKGRREEQERQEEQKAKEKGRELQITLLWKPHMANVAFFREAGKE